MQQCDGDWVPLLHLGHTEVIVTTSDQYQRRTKNYKLL